MKNKTQPDVIFIVLDTLRADRLSCYNYTRETTPHIDAFAEKSVLFEWAISPGQWTIPAHASFFTGEYPTTHMTTQIYDHHSEAFPTLAETLHQAGYQTVGFCNNPLLGVVENDLDRGFESFYNYGGTLPNRPAVVETRANLPTRAAQWVVRQIRRFITSFQDIFARNDALLRIAMHPYLVTLWQRYGNFKGNTVLSLRDILGYLNTHQKKENRRPLFTFINMMETHLPFRPPTRFARRFAPYYQKDREARKFMDTYNCQPYRWMKPIVEPLTELQGRIINDLYDAEIAYEDHMLRHLLNYLDQPEVRDNTLVIITSDHGEGMNNHNFVGHSLVAYDDLIHVPLIIRYPPGYAQGKRISTPVSTRRLFHTVLEAAGVEPLKTNGHTPTEVERLSLARTVEGQDPEDTIYTEAYVPQTLIALMDNEKEEVMQRFRCKDMRRAAYRDLYKLITVSDEPDELFNLAQDPGERQNLINEQPEITQQLNEQLQAFITQSEQRRPENVDQAQIDLDDETEIADRLRALGYIE